METGGRRQAGLEAGLGVVVTVDAARLVGVGRRPGGVIRRQRGVA